MSRLTQVISRSGFKTGDYTVFRRKAGTWLKGRQLYDADDVDFTVTSDVLHSVAHGLSTGDGPFQVIGDEDDTPPAGYPKLTNFWVIVDTADQLRLALSSEDALAGTPVLPVDSGTADAVFSLSNSLTSFLIEASIQPLTGRQLMDLPEGKRGDETCWLFSSTELRSVDPETLSDRVIYRGESWVVTKTEQWEGRGGVHWRCVIARRPTP